MKNFPSVNCISLHESDERRAFMEQQASEFNFKRLNIYQTDRFEKLSKYINVDTPQDFPQNGTIVSHLNCLRDWYVSCDEEYAIFCEDDISFECLRYWDFTWDEFIENLPTWDVVQLTRFVYPCGEDYRDTLKLNFKYGRWWGANSLMKRSHVKNILDLYFKGYNEYSLYVPGGWQTNIENLLFYWVDCGNVPILIENKKFSSTYTREGIFNTNYMCSEYILHLWKTRGYGLSAKELLKI